MDKDVLAALDEYDKINRMKHREQREAARWPSEDSPYLSMQQVLNHIPVSRSKLHQMISVGTFPAKSRVECGFAQWLKTDVERWIRGTRK